MPRLIGGPYDGLVVGSDLWDQPVILVGPCRHRYEAITDPDSHQPLGGFAYAPHNDSGEPDMILNTEATFTVATNNIMSLPENPQVLTTLRAAPLATVVMVQEADLPQFQDALEHVGAHRVTAKVPGDRTHSCYVMYDPAIWEHVHTGFQKAYDGEAHISLTRHIAVTILRHKAIGVEFAFVSYHAVTKGNDRLRKAMRKEGTKAIRRIIKHQRSEGRPVILGCDQNSTRNLFPSRTLHTRHRIDHLYAWSGVGVRLRKAKGGRKVIATRSDHDTLEDTFTATVTSR